MRENICTNMTNKGLLSNIYKQFIQFNIKKQTTQLKNRQKNRHFSKEEMQMTNRQGEDAHH